MRKPELRSIWLLLLIILAVAVVETANLLVPIPTVGSVTVKDEVGETSRPELPFLDIVEATVEKNKTDITIVVQINGYVPSQVEPSKEEYVRYIYYFNVPSLEPSKEEYFEAYYINTLVCVELEGNVWTPMLGHFVYKMGWYVDYAGEDFPGSFLINKEARTIQIILDLDLLREREVYRRTGVTSDRFTWSIDSNAGYQRNASAPRTQIDQISSYFPDYLSFYRPAIHAVALVIIGMGGIGWWQKARIWNFLTGRAYR